MPYCTSPVLSQRPSSAPVEVFHSMTSSAADTNDAPSGAIAIARASLLWPTPRFSPSRLPSISVRLILPVARSQIRITLSLLPAIARVPSEDTSSARIRPLSCFMTRRQLPLARSHNRSVPSHAPLSARSDPTAQIWLAKMSWPSSVRSTLYAGTRHTLILPSSHADSRRLPSGVNTRLAISSP